MQTRFIVNLTPWIRWHPLYLIANPGGRLAHSALRNVTTARANATAFDSIESAREAIPDGYPNSRVETVLVNPSDC